jgi:Ca-activated chloride channel family protein
MRWSSPWAWLFILPLLGALWWNFIRKEKFHASLQFSSLGLLKSISPGFKAQFAFLPKMLKFLALGCAVMALARPQASNSKVNRNVEGIDIMIVFDVSDSMEIEDMQPDNRITAAKSVIHKFIKGRTSDRIGLIIFAAESYTAIGVALANGVARLKDSTAKSRVMILLTDGENNSGTIDPETATEIAKGYGIKIYTIGVGVNGQAQLPTYVKDTFGNKVKTYQPIHSTVNMELLDHIAKETGGQSFRAVDTDALKQVFSSIDKLEKTKIQVSQYVRYTELFPSWLKMGAIFYLAQLVLSLTFLRRVP